MDGHIKRQAALLIFPNDADDGTNRGSRLIDVRDVARDAVFIMKDFIANSTSTVDSFVDEANRDAGVEVCKFAESVF